MPDDTIIADVLLSSTENGDPRINIGEHTDGEGFGADTALYANGDGFVSIPNAADENGAAQVVAIQDGHTKRAIASRDNRYASRAGTLAPGDRAIVSDSEAWFKLTRASDKIEIVSGNMSITLDGLTGKVEITNVLGKISVTSTGVTMQSGTTASITISPLGVAIVVPPNPGPPASPLIGFTVNGTSMIVP